MARLLTVSQYLAGADQVKCIELFPDDRKVISYDFDKSISGYNFSADYQSLLLDEVKYDRVTGDINLSDTTVSGYFNNFANVDANNINILSAVSGTVDLTIPANRYTGPLLPSARTDVVMTVLSFQWEDGTDITQTTKTRHRWAIIERFEPGVTIGNPNTDPGFTSL